MSEYIGWFSSGVLLLTIGKQIYKQWQDETSEAFARVLGEVHATIEAEGIDYALIGGRRSAAMVSWRTASSWSGSRPPCPGLGTSASPMPSSGSNGSATSGWASATACLSAFDIDCGLRPLGLGGCV